ncbi:hypothetical protein Tco_1311312 [Tanacetum coccineum]
MLGSTTPELHGQFENSPPYEMHQELKSRFEKQARVEQFDLIQTFHAYKQEEGKLVGPYVIKMKNYMAQLERLGYVPPRDLSVGLIMNGLTGDFAGFLRNYNMHNMGKTIRELHALLIEYEKSLPKKVATPQVMAIQGGRIQKANKKSQKAKGKGSGIVNGIRPDQTFNKDQPKDTPPSEITSELPMEVEGFEPPHEEEALVRRFVRTRRAPERLCLNVEAEEHSLGDLNEPANYKASC